MTVRCPSRTVRGVGTALRRSRPTSGREWETVAVETGDADQIMTIRCPKTKLGARTNANHRRVDVHSRVRKHCERRSDGGEPADSRLADAGMSTPGKRHRDGFSPPPGQTLPFSSCRGGGRLRPPSNPPRRTRGERLPETVPRRPSAKSDAAFLRGDVRLPDMMLLPLHRAAVGRLTGFSAQGRWKAKIVSYSNGWRLSGKLVGPSENSKGPDTLLRAS